MKLTNAQEKAYNQIVDYIEFAKSCKTLKEYIIKEEMQGMENRPDYDELLETSTKRYEQDEKYYEEKYKKYWLDAKEKNIALTDCVSSSTLRVLEKKGLIKIIEDGRNLVDRVELL